MSSSVSSERAFSQGGITISKRRNCLKGDIVEALQCIKCTIRHDLLFQEPAPSSILEAEETSDCERENASAGGDLAGSDDESDSEGISWDGLLVEDDEDEAMYCSD
jgi:hAT family C-terminal dimerisation region